MFEKVYNDIAEKAEKNITVDEGDYYGSDGALYCGVCNTPKTYFVKAKGKFEYVPCKHRQDERATVDHMKMVDELKSACFGDEELLRCRFENDDGQDEELIKKAKDYVNNFDVFRDKGLGMLFYGGVGNGKTFASACIANALIEREIRCYMTDILALYREWGTNFGNHREDLLKKIKAVPLLIIDDLGVERKSEAMYEMVYSVINERLKAKKPTVVSTNMTFDEYLSPKGVTDERIYSRLYEMCIPIECKGENRRTKKMFDNLELFEAVVNAKK